MSCVNTNINNLLILYALIRYIYVRINREFIMMQVSFLKNDENLSHYLVMTDVLEKLLSTRARRLYRELLRISLQKSKEKFLLNYGTLEQQTEYKGRNLRNAFVELEAAGLVERDKIKGTHSVYVKVDTKFLKKI